MVLGYGLQSIKVIIMFMFKKKKRFSFLHKPIVLLNKTSIYCQATGNNIVFCDMLLIILKNRQLLTSILWITEDYGFS